METQVVKRMVELSKVQDAFNVHLGNCFQALKAVRHTNNKVLIAVVERDYELLEATFKHVLAEITK
jgi:hypothetical protein